MSKLLLRFLFVISLLALDGLVATILLVHGNDWNLFAESLANFSFATSFIDLCILAYLRASVILGGLIGVLGNLKEGPNRCKKSLRIIVVFACINGYYACIKLLIFSENKQFVAGPKVYWFWALFSWTLAGSTLLIFLWKFLAKFQKGNVTAVNPLDEDVFNNENQPLLKDQKSYCSINKEEVSHVCINGTERLLSTENKSSLLVSNVDSYQNDSTFSDKCKEEKSKKESEEKGYDQLLSKATLGTMLSYTIPDWPLIVFGVIFLMGASIAQVFLPLYIGKVISGIVLTKSTSDFTKNILIMGLISLIASICAGLRGGCFMNVIQRLNIRVRNALFHSITQQEIGFFDDMKTGDITSRLTSDTTTMSDTVGLDCNIFLRNIVKAIGVCVFMFALSWRMSIITFLGLPLVFGVSEVYGNYYKKLQKLVQDRLAIANEVAEEVCSSMQTVRSFANESGEKERYAAKLSDVYKVQVKQAISYSGYIWCTQNIELLLTVGTLWFGGHLLIESELTSENFIAFILYQEELGECFSEIGEVYTGLMQALGAAEKVFELIKRTPKISTEDGTEKPELIRGQISFKNVTFSYPTRPNQPILKDVSFDVKPGEVVALVGPSGGGKSSCVKLLQRFYDPTSGSVLLDGIPVSAYKHEYLHEKVSLVGQEPVLYARSIRENIVYGLDSSHYSDKDIIDASIKANAYNFIMELPEQYETETGEKGTQLSGGQKQRVAIARAMVRNPRVLLLDEATSALDTESEYLVQEALERSKSDRTVLLIAHRLSTVERADRIVVIVKGQVKEIGNHQELMEKRGLYFKLVHRQLHNSMKIDKPPEKQEANVTNVSSNYDTLPNFHAGHSKNLIPTSLCHHHTSNEEVSGSLSSTSSITSLTI